MDFLYLGRFPSFAELERRPNKLQLSVFARLRALIAVCADSTEEFDAVPGRSGPELAAALLHLERFFDLHPELSQSYVQHKPAVFSEDKQLLPKDEYPELIPYRALDASRLKLIGKGKWPMADHLDGPLWLPFQEPRFLLHGDRDDPSVWPSFASESRDENLKLAKVWDARGLLRLYKRPCMKDHFCKVFNCYKNVFTDRQIGDRRIPNSRERAIDGPSHHLPPGFLLTNLRIEPYEECLVGSITDRRDFYHQAKVTDERARSTLLSFSFAEEDLACTDAWESREHENPKKKAREVVGDGFEISGSSSFEHAAKEGMWYPAFGSLFQGDHLGVEFALKAHEDVLQKGGLLKPHRRLQGHALFPLGKSFEGLIIDDYFAIGCEPIDHDPVNTFAAKALSAAREVYSAAGLEGSAEKDVEAETTFKAAGAEIVSSRSAVRRGVTTVGAPLAKRLALSALTLRAAKLNMITAKLASRLAGSWTSVLLYRRCLTAAVDGFFQLAAEAEASGKNAALPLPRKVAQELSILAACVPLATSNIAIKYSPTIYASDASLGLGAVVSAEVDESLVEVLRLGSDKKGCYTRLDGPALAMLAAAGEEVHEGYDLPLPELGPSKGLLMYYDFVEFFGGSGRVSKCMADLGFTVAPCLDLTASKHYDMTDVRLLEWCLHMIEQGRFRSFLTEPPCTTFSPAAYPAVRSYLLPEGFDRSCPKTWLGNMLAFRSFVLLRHGLRFRRPCGKEQPRRSKMAWMQAWLALLRLGFRQAVIASCQFGSPHKKEFVLLLYGLDVERLEVKCPGGHSHVKIQGSLTKGSAVYTWPLAAHIAAEFGRALKRAQLLESDQPQVDGHESVVVNDLLQTASWKEEKSWYWKRKSHINVLEAHSGIGVLTTAAEKQPDSRFLGLLDSRVAKGALAKGRSSSLGLQRACKRSAAIQVCFGLYPGWSFAPTRLNVAYDPTRRVRLRQSSGQSLIPHLDKSQLQLMHSKHLSRWAANWIRLYLLLLVLPGPASAECIDGRAVCRESFYFWFPSHFSEGFEEQQREGWSFEEVHDSSWEEVHDSSRSASPQACSKTLSLFNDWISTALTLASAFGSAVSSDRGLVSVCHWILEFGFLCQVLAPFVWFVVLSFPSWSCPVGRKAPLRSLWILVGFSFAEAMVPQTAVERGRAERREGTNLIATRVARKDTLDRRAKLLSDFRAWLYQTHEVYLSQLLTAKPPDAEEISRWLTLYGQEMFLAGKSYGKFAETINAVAAARPIVRKQLVGAWDLAFAWLVDEPTEHHPALPLSILLAMLSLALMWGWPLEAGVISLAWCGILRVGEVLLADRSDLILPCDAAPGTLFGLLRIKTPKTRGRAARHQAARIDPPDILMLLTAIYNGFPASSKLWPYSAETLRKRFNHLLAALGLQTERSKGRRPFNLGSLRPGGATHLLLASEDSELVRRRGRWVTSRVMEIYLQEIMYTTYAEKLDRHTRTQVLQLAGNFSKILNTAVGFLNCAVPPQTWWSLFQASDGEELGEAGSDGVK